MKEEKQETTVVLDIPLMSFIQAFTLLLLGKKIHRYSWNGKNMYIYINKGSISPENVYLHYVEGVPVNSNMFVIGDNKTTTRLPNLNMKSASGNTVTGWLASQTDILACDWMEYEDGLTD